MKQERNICTFSSAKEAVSDAWTKTRKIPNVAAVFDIDDTLMFQDDNDTQEVMRDFYNLVRGRMPVYLITGRFISTDSIYWCVEGLKNIGIVGYKELIMRPADDDFYARFKQNERDRIKEHIVLTVGDNWYDHKLTTIELDNISYICIQTDETVMLKLPNLDT